jgi:hypothetical protein
MRRLIALALFALVAASLLTFCDARSKVGVVAAKANGSRDNNDGISISTRPRLSALGGDRHTFEVVDDTFLLDGEPFRILSGE